VSSAYINVIFRSNALENSEKHCINSYICREGKNRNTLYFYSKHSGVMTWQAHVSGQAPSPPPTGSEESEDTQVELVLFELSFEQVELKAVLSSCCTCYFQHILASLKIKEHHQNIFILCVIILNQV